MKIQIITLKRGLKEMGLADRDYMWDRDIYKDFYNTKSSKPPSSWRKSLRDLHRKIKNVFKRV